MGTDTTNKNLGHKKFWFVWTTNFRRDKAEDMCLFFSIMEMQEWIRASQPEKGEVMKGVYARRADAIEHATRILDEERDARYDPVDAEKRRLAYIKRGQR